MMMRPEPLASLMKSLSPLYQKVVVVEIGQRGK
jgi:hypothetical protein